MTIIESYKTKKFDKLEKKIDIYFENKNLLVQSFIHRSFLNENKEFPLPHNERLEFLGDAVLELIVTEYLFENYLNPEGELTNWRAALVNGTMCASVARDLDMEKYLFLSHGETKDVNIKARDYILSNALEALIGSIYLDQGFEKTKKFINDFIIIKLPEVLEQGLWMDPKSRFQESAQEIIGITPTYKVISESGPDHAKDFIIGVFLDKEKIAEGKGTSKQEAQTNAAENALKIKNWKGPKITIIKRKESDPLG
jgi:ribonuclease-3